MLNKQVLVPGNMLSILPNVLETNNHSLPSCINNQVQSQLVVAKMSSKTQQSLLRITNQPTVPNKISLPKV